MHLHPDERLGETALAVASNTRDPEYLPLGHLHPVHQDGGSGLRVYHKPLDIQTNSCGRAIRSARRPDLVPDHPLSQKRAVLFAHPPRVNHLPSSQHRDFIRGLKNLL